MKSADAMVALVNVQSMLDAHIELDRPLPFDTAQVASRHLALAVDHFAKMVSEHRHTEFAFQLVRAVAGGRQITVADRRKARAVADAA